MIAERGGRAVMVRYGSPVRPGPLEFGELLGRCVSGDAAAWEEFIHRYRRTVAATVYTGLRCRGGDSLHAADDLIQTTFLRLCDRDYRALRTFQGDDERKFHAFLKVVAARVVSTFFRETKSPSNWPTGGFSPMEAAEAMHSRNGEREILARVEDGEIDALLGQDVDPNSAARNRMVFWLYYRHGFSAADIARIGSVRLTESGVESLLRKLVQSIRRQLTSGGES